LVYLQRYGLAVLSVGVALGASLLLDHFHFRVPSALLLLFTVAISSWYAGAGPAVLAAILSTISFYWYFVEPVRTIFINRSEIPYFVIFTAFAALLSRFGTFRQRAEADLRRTHDQLKVERPKLGSRTIALLYFAFSSCWILFTDRLVHGLGLSNAYLLKVSEAKGILFISLSTLLMYVLVEKALRQRHSVATAYWQLVETAQEGVWSVDAEGNTVFANENMAAILGTSPGEMIGKSILPFVPQEKKDELLNHLLQREQGLQEHYEFPFLRADGAQVWTLLRVSPVLTDGQHSGCLALVSDITKRKHAEEALRRLNRELRAISNCNQALLRATDEQSLLEEICRIVCEEAGYRMAWVAYAEHDDAKSVRPVAWTGAEEGYLASAGITWADTERGRSPTGTAIRNGKSCCIQDFAKDPRLAPWREGLLQRGFRSGIALPLKDENDNAFGSLAIHSAQPNAFTSEEVRLLEELAADLAFGIVTLRSQAARQRAEQEVALLSFALNNVREAALLTDDTARFHYVNNEACRVLGYTRAELLGMSIPDIDPEFPAQRWSDHWRDLKAQRSLSFEGLHRTRDGRIFPVEISANYFEYGGRAYNLGLVRDISERKRAEERLRQSEAYLAEAQRLSHTGSWALDVAGGNYVYSSEEYLRISGFDPQQGLPTKDQALQQIHPDDLDKFWQAFQKLIDEKVDSEGEYRIVLPDGTVKYVHAIRHPVLNANGELVEIVGTTVDITERKRAEESLRESDKRFRILFEKANDAIFLENERDEIIEVNQRACALLGYSREELLTMKVSDLQAPEIRGGIGSVVRGEMEKHGGATFETVDLHRSGRRIAIEVSNTPISDRGQELVLSIVRDITERKRAEEALRRAEGYLVEAQRLTHTGAWATDAEPKPLYWSEELFRLYGLDSQQGFPTHEQAVQRVHPEDRDRYVQAFHRVIHQKVDSDVEFRTVLPDGTIRYLYGLGHPILSTNGDVVEVVGTTVDITERKCAEEERTRLRQLEADLAHIDRVSILGELAASIAHEVNQPLSGIVSSGSACLRWLARDVPDLEEAREAALRIVRDGKRAGEIIARIRALTKKASAPREKLDLNETIREVLALVGDEAKRNTVVIRTRFGDDVFPVLGDQVQLQQVVLNLVMNAIEAMSRVGDRARELVITTRNIDPDQLQVTVEDSGTGIDPQMIDKIFGSFYTTKPGGMGMGLSISRSILQAHGGRLWATAKDGAGTIFHFTLPKYHEEESNAGVAAV